MNRVEQLINRYLARMPDARHANSMDPQYHAEIARLRKLLTLLDMVMEDEEIPEDKRVRIIRCVIYGGPDEAAALERMQRMERDIKAAMWR
jgi:hypothetical protein